jgi:hypothetical protein
LLCLCCFFKSGCTILYLLRNELRMLSFSLVVVEKKKNKISQVEKSQRERKKRRRETDTHTDCIDSLRSSKSLEVFTSILSDVVWSM